MVGQNSLKLRKNESWLAQLHVRKTELLMHDRCSLLSTDKKSQHCVKLYFWTAPCQISTWFNTDIAIFQQETTRPWQRAHPLRQQACVPPPRIMSTGFRQKPQGVSFIMKRWMRRPFQLKVIVQRSTSVLLWRSFFLFVTSWELWMPTQTSYLFPGSHLPLMHRHTLLRKRSVMLFKLKKESYPEATFVLPSHIFQTGCGSVTSPYTRMTLTFHPPIHLILLQRGTQQRGYYVTFVVAVSRGSLVTGDTNRNFPGESPWPGSLPSAHTALPNPVSPERELIALYRWIDRGWMMRQVSNVTRRKQVWVLSRDVTQQAWVESMEATHVLEKWSIQWRQWTTQLDQDLLSLYALAECFQGHLTFSRSGILLWIHVKMHSITHHTTEVLLPTSLKEFLHTHLPWKAVPFCPAESQTQVQELKRSHCQLTVAILVPFLPSIAFSIPW